MDIFDDPKFKPDITKHPKCQGYYDEHGGFYDCAYDTKISCDDCKYGLGRKDPEAECNQI